MVIDVKTEQSQVQALLKTAPYLDPGVTCSMVIIFVHSGTDGSHTQLLTLLHTGTGHGMLDTFKRSHCTASRDCISEADWRVLTSHVCPPFILWIKQLPSPCWINFVCLSLFIFFFCCRCTSLVVIYCTLICSPRPILCWELSFQPLGVVSWLHWDRNVFCSSDWSWPSIGLLLYKTFLIK